MTADELQSKCIDFLRFPLIVGVVLIHAYTDALIINGVDYGAGAQFSVYNFVSGLFSQIFGRLSVPLFFFIAGYLFFYRTNWSIGVYREKLRRRIRTLLIPYLFWNFLIIMLYFIAQTLPPTAELFSGANKLIRDYTFSDFIAAFWQGNSGYPISFQFWFIRDLMVIVLLSPLVRLFVKYLKVYGVILLGFVWFSGLAAPVAGFSSVGFFFFTCGACLSINRLNIVEEFGKLFRFSIIVYPVIVFADLLSQNSAYHLYIHNAGLIAGILFVFNVTSYFMGKGCIGVNKFLASACFFVFALHEPLMTFVKKFLFSLIRPRSDLSMILLYVLIPTFVILFCVSVYAILKKYLPKFTGVISGVR